MDPAPLPAKLQALANDLADGTPRSESVRTLLSWFRAERRGRLVVHEIQATLRRLKIATDPDFRFAYIDETITFQPIGSTSPTAGPGNEDRHDAVVVPYTEASDAQQPVVQGDEHGGIPIEDAPYVTSVVADPTFRIGRLPSANRVPLSVTSDDSVSCAITHMLANQYSQLPVLEGERTVKGKISWRTIGSRLATGGCASVVRECVEPCESISADASLFSAIDVILNDDCVLVRDRNNKVVGMVTPYDLSVQFNQLGEPFLLIGEIENHIRRLLANKFTAAELRSAGAPPGAAERDIADISDLTFGECIRLIEDPQSWDRLGVRVDRTVFTKYLNDVRVIRNNVMHFDPEATDIDELQRLRLTVRFFQSLISIRVL